MVEVQIPCLLSLSHLDGFLPLVGTLWGGMFDSTQLHGVERWDFDGTLMINTLRPELMSAHWVQFWSWMALFDYPLAKPDCFMDIQNDFRRLCEFYISARYWMSSLHCLATVTCLQHLCWEVIICVDFCCLSGLKSYLDYCPQQLVSACFEILYYHRNRVFQFLLIGISQVHQCCSFATKAFSSISFCSSRHLLSACFEIP